MVGGGVSLVRCRKCGVIKVTRHKTFYHCGRRQDTALNPVDRPKSKSKPVKTGDELVITW